MSQITDLRATTSSAPGTSREAASLATEKKTSHATAYMFTALSIVALGALVTGGLGIIPTAGFLAKTTLSVGGVASFIAGMFSVRSNEPSRPSIQFPIGIPNAQMNCWANSLLQMCRAVPMLQEFLIGQKERELSPIGLVLAQYENDQERGRTISRADSQQVRLCLSRFSDGISRDGAVQCDASEGLSLILERMNSPKLPKMQAIYRCKNKAHEWVTSSGVFDPMPKLELILDGSRSFLQIFESFLKKKPKESEHNYQDPSTDTRDGHVVSEELLFEKTPDELFISLKRFVNQKKGFFTRLFSDASHELMKITDPIDVPETFHLKEEFVRTREGADYQVDAFIQHKGPTCNGGHYIAYIKAPDGTWFACDDSDTRAMTAEEVKAALSDAYIYHFHRL